MELLNTFSSGLIGVGALAAGFGFAYAQFRSGGSKAKDDLIATLKETATVERDKASRLADEKTTLIKSHQEQLNELNKQIGILQGKADANEKKMNEYLDILKGRSPEQDAFMKFVTEVSGESAKYMRDSSEILSDIKTFMAMMNGEIAKGNIFNKQILEDTAHGEGKVLRKKV